MSTYLGFRYTNMTRVLSYKPNVRFLFPTFHTYASGCVNLCNILIDDKVGEIRIDKYCIYPNTTDTWWR